MSKIQFGVTYPAGLQASCALERYAPEVEAMGCDSMWLIENLGVGTPGFECMTTLGYMAAATQTMTLGTSVLLLPLRNPVLLAQAVNTLDQLSNGRIIIGLGVGDAGQHTAVGSDRRTRGARADEYLQLLVRLWTEEEVTFDGRYQRTEAYTLRPLSVQQPHVPIWIGGHAAAAASRAARLASGFIPVGVEPRACVSLFDGIDSEAAELGRPPMTRALHAYFAHADSTEQALDMASATISHRYQREVRVTDASAHFLGSAETCVAQLKAFMDAGVTHFIFDPVAPFDQMLEQVRTLFDQILSQVHR